MKGQKKPYYIKEPYGLPFELTEKDKFKKPNNKTDRIEEKLNLNYKYPYMDREF